MHYVLVYEIGEDYMEKRTPHRAEHVGLAKQAYERGELVLAGALAEPVDGVMLVFRGPTADAAEMFAKNDPYVKNGVVKGWRVRKWTTVIGDGASV
jgi:uncharacterized protein YciI